jgi:hypothetical protein
MSHSIFSFITFFHVIFKISQFKNIKINLHQSRAGIGNKLNIHKFIEIIAQIIKK